MHKCDRHTDTQPDTARRNRPHVAARDKNSENAISAFRQTPGDDCGFENEVSLVWSVEDLDEHTVHVVSLDSVPEERDENEVIAEDVGDATAEARAGDLLGDVEHDEHGDQRYA